MLNEIEKNFLIELMSKSDNVTVIHKELLNYVNDEYTYIITFKVKKEDK